MAVKDAGIFSDLTVDHITFQTEDLAAGAEWLVGGYGFDVCATSVPDADERSLAVSGGRIRVVLTQPVAADHAGAAYLSRHGDGVSDIALGVSDAGEAYAEAVRRGARPVSAPVWRDGVRTATIMGFGDVTHTFVERAGNTAWSLPGLRPVGAPHPGTGNGLTEIDHFAVCLEAGQLDPTVAFYEDVLGFRMVFAERIEVGEQAIETKAVQSASGTVTLTLIEPDVSREPGQIDTFLKVHGGPGVQHVAFATRDVVSTVASLGAAGVSFLSTPAAYYELLAERMDVSAHSPASLEALGILVDEDHDGQLFQIFARSVHPRGTFFLEVVERMGAQAFGGGNITALYQAVERQRHRDEAPDHRVAR